MTMVWTHNLTGGVILQHGRWKMKDMFLHMKVKLNYTTNGQAPSTLKLSPSPESSLLCYRMSRYRRKNRLFDVNSQQYVCFSTEAAKKTRRKKPQTKESSDNVQSVQKESTPRLVSTEELQSTIKEQRKKYSYVFKQSVAEKIVTAVMKHRTNPSAPVLDVRAGPGLVSKEFLRQGVSKVVALEMETHFSPFLSTLQNEVGSDRFCFFNWQMENLYLKLHSPAQNESVKAFQKMESDVAESLMTSHSSSEVPYSLISIGGKNSNEQFVYYVVRNLPNDDPVLSRGRVELFFLAHPRFKYKIDYLSSFQKTCAGVPSVIRDRSESTRFSYLHALLCLLYDVDVLGEFGSDEFFPSFNSVRAKHDKDSIDSSKRLLIRMQPKKNIDEILPLQHHTPFMNFLFQLYKKKAVRTIPAMEMLIPGCGLRMLAEGFTMMDIIITSNPENFIRLYKMMLEWPEYRSSPLHSYLVLKMTGSTDDGSLSDVDGH